MRATTAGLLVATVVLTLMSKGCRGANLTMVARGQSYITRSEGARPVWRAYSSVCA